MGIAVLNPFVDHGHHLVKTADRRGAQKYMGKIEGESNPRAHQGDHQDD